MNMRVEKTPPGFLLMYFFKYSPTIAYSDINATEYNRNHSSKYETLGSNFGWIENVENIRK